MNEMPHTEGESIPLIQHPLEVQGHSESGEITTVLVTPFDIALSAVANLVAAPNDTARDTVERVPLLVDAAASMRHLTEEEKAKIDPTVVEEVERFRLRSRMIRSRRSK